jgi:peptidoglycan/xylan/chitin deacetylase (PgdA/CDA1 family)
MPLSGKRLVILYHNFYKTTRQKYSEEYYDIGGAVSVDRLRSHISWLSQFAEFVSLNELVRSSGTEGWKVAITLDDGYRNNLSLALPVFAQFGAPVTWFVSTRFVESDDLPWWDLVDYAARVARPLLTIETSDRQYRFDLRDAQHRRRFRKQCGQWFMWASQVATNRIRHQIENSISASPPSNAFADRKELIKASRSPLLDIGGHTVSHPNLAHLSTPEVRREVRKGKEKLETWTDQPVRWFAFPYGGREHWNGRTKQIIQEEEFDGAVTTVRADVDQAADRFEIPRLTLSDTRSLWKTKAWIFAPNTCRELYRLKQNWVDGGANAPQENVY